MNLPPLVLTQLLTQLSPQDQGSFRQVSRYFDQVYREFWLREAQLNFSSGIDRHGNLIDSQRKFHRARLQCLRPTRLKSLPSPLINQCLEFAGFSGDYVTVQTLLDQGGDPLPAIFGAARGNQLELLNLILNRELPDLELVTNWLIRGFLAGGHLPEALTLGQANRTWIPLALRYGQTQLVDLIEQLYRSVPGLPSITPRSRWEIGQWLARYGHPNLARKYGYSPSPAELAVYQPGTQAFRDVVQDSSSIELYNLPSLIIAAKRLDLIPIYLDLTSKLRGSFDRESSLGMFFRAALSGRHWDLLPHLETPNISQIPWRLILSTYDRDLLEWYLRQPGAPVEQVLDKLEEENHQTLAGYLRERLTN